METLAPPNSAAFTAEQKEYLLGFFAGAMQRGAQPVRRADSERASSPTIRLQALQTKQSLRKKPGSALRFPISASEELWKYEQNPLDIWDKLLAHADENRAPAPDDLFRFKFHGLFYVAPAQDSFMLRLRVPGGILTAHQMRGLADDGRGVGFRPRRHHHARQPADSRVSAQRHRSRPQQGARSWHDVARFRCGQHSQHHRIAHHRHRSDRTLRCGSAGRCTAPLHSEFARPVRAAAKI